MSISNREVTSFSDVQKTVLPNGIAVLFRQSSGSHSLSISGVIDGAGAALAEKKQAARVLASMLTRGTAKFTKDSIAETLEIMSASGFRFAVGNFGTAFGANLVREDFEPFLNLLSDMIRHPRIDPDELERVKPLYLASIAQAANDTVSVAGNALSRAIYQPQHPFWSRSFPELAAETAALGLSDLEQFHASHFVPSGTIFSIVGDADFAEIISMVEMAFGDWTGPAKQLLLPYAPAQPSKQRINIELADKANADLIIGLASLLTRNSADFFAASLANRALGGDTIGARLGASVRVKHGLTYGITSSFGDTSRLGAPWMVSLSLEAKNVERALSLIDEVVNRFVGRGIGKAELETLKRQAANGFLVGLRTPLAIASTLTTLTALGLDAAQEMNEYPAKVRAVTKDEVDAAARTYFRLDEATTVVAGSLSA